MCICFSGFLSTGDQYCPGNFGLFDQQRALEFIKENIRDFRGNPGMVTIFGQSTGAACVGLHLLSPRSVSKFSLIFLPLDKGVTRWIFFFISAETTTNK